MKDFLKDKTWEDWLIYSIGAVILFGLLLFAIGFWWKFETLIEIPNGGYSDTINRNVKSYVSDSDLNLFQYVSTISTSTIGAMTSTLLSMTILAIVGFSFIMFGLSSIVALIVFVMVYEWVWPVIKDKITKDK